MTTTLSLQPVIMAGGSGTRLWPLSRSGYPKQFLVLAGNTSLLQQAAQRLAGLAAADIVVTSPLVVGNEEHRFMVLDQLREVHATPSAVLLEPMGRNTAPAVTLAALQALEGGGDPVLVVTPSDQTVADDAAFIRALQAAARRAASGEIVILGIRPDRPETGYGYIRADGSAVAQFVEKPDTPTAERYLADGGYYWNAGIFVLKASVWLAALERFRPDIAEATRAAWAGRATDAQFVRPDKALFGAVPSESVDYAVMERCQRAGVAAGVVQSAEDMFRRDPQLAARGFFEAIPHFKRGTVHASGIPLGLTATPGRTTHSGSSVGHDNAYVLREVVGLSEAEWEAAVRAGAIEVKRGA